MDIGKCETQSITSNGKVITKLVTRNKDIIEALIYSFHHDLHVENLGKGFNFDRSNDINECTFYFMRDDDEQTKDKRL